MKPTFLSILLFLIINKKKKEKEKIPSQKMM